MTCLILVHYMQESNDLECLVRLLQLGLKSLRLIDTKEYYEDKLVINLLYITVLNKNKCVTLSNNDVDYMTFDLEDLPLH